MGIWSNKSIFLLIFLFIALILIKILISLQFPTPWILGDEVDYAEKARVIIAEHTIFVQSTDIPDIPFGYPMFIAPAFLLSQDKVVLYHIILSINAILTSLAMFPAYFIVRKFTTNGLLPVAGALLVASLPSITTYTFFIMSENLFMTLVIFSAFFYVKAWESDTWFWTLLAVGSMAFLAATRIIGIAFIGGFVIGTLILAYQ